MNGSAQRSVSDYVKSLPPDRRAEIETVRKRIRTSLPEGFEETFLFGMIAWVVPFSRLATTYNGKPLLYAALAAQKNYSSVYLHGIYGDPREAAWFKSAYQKSGKRMDVGMSCVRFRSIDDLPLELIGEAIGRKSVDAFVADYLKVYPDGRRPAAKRAAAKRKPAAARKPKATVTR